MTFASSLGNNEKQNKTKTKEKKMEIVNIVLREKGSQ